MRKEYGRALRTLFEEALRHALPQFAPASVHSPYLFPGERAFRWVPRDGLACWVLLCPDPKGHDAFSLEIGWSKKGRFPELSARPFPQDPSADHAEFAHEEYVTALDGLAGRPAGRWFIDKVAVPANQEQYLAELARSLQPIPAAAAREKVAPFVARAVESLRRNGVPYLESFVAAERGE